MKILVENDEYREFILAYNNVKINGMNFFTAKLLVKVTILHEQPELIYDFNIKTKGWYIKIRFKDFLGNGCITAELTKVGDNIHFHEMSPEN